MYFAIIIILLATILFFKKTRTLHEMIFPKLYRSVDFPESRFKPKDRIDFQKKVDAGYQNMKRLRVIICGITKDDEYVLPKTIQRIERTGTFFRDYKVVIYENDSTDETPRILKKWESKNDHIKIFTRSDLNLHKLIPSRTERLAYCRNQYLNHIRQSGIFDDYEYMIVLDMDLNGGWSYDGIASSFSNMEWDMMVSNSIGYHNLRKTYYDIYALQPRNILRMNGIYRLIGEGWQLKRNDPMIPIQSGFGGLAIYRKNTVISKQYIGACHGKDICEHRSLNKENLLRCFLNPSQITVTGTQDTKVYQPVSRWKSTLRKIFLNW